VSVRVRIFYPDLQRLLADSPETSVEGGTVGECLADLVMRYPGTEELLFDARGHLLKRVYVFVNAEGMYKAEFERPVTDKDVLILAVLATGG
jgi:molybdopterin converting factor small subunit